MYLAHASLVAFRNPVFHGDGVFHLVRGQRRHLVAQRADGLVVQIDRHGRQLRAVGDAQPVLVLDHEVDIYLVRQRADDAHIGYIAPPLPRVVFIGIARPGAAIYAGGEVDAPCQAVVVLCVQSAGAWCGVAHAGNIGDGVNQYLDAAGQNAVAVRSGLLCLHHHVGVGLSRRYLAVFHGVEVFPVLSLDPCSRRNGRCSVLRFRKRKAHRRRGPVCLLAR